MKTHTFHPCNRSAGFALVIVLGLLVLVVALIVGFLFQATNERTAAAGFSAAVTGRQLADRTVSIVQSQINDAVGQGTGTVWTSQPGMVRTFDTNGTMLRAYKLYSAEGMISGSVSLTDDLPPADWSQLPGIWTDLNAPIQANGTKNFPIIDPTALQTIESVGPVEGFSVTNAPGATPYQPLAMPVRWLYVLEDGAVVAASGSGTTVSVPGASAENPIVGRVAFWTDDDSAKVNINTAGGGVDANDTFWDTPRAYTKTDVESYALRQPVQGEYQRYPGHPGTVMMSAVLPGLKLQNYMDLTPRLAFGGSEGGTKLVENLSAPISSPPKNDRLYSSVDELIFGPTRAKQPVLSKAIVESRKFFLTAHSRSPEINLFNLPRVAVWPVYELNSNGTANSVYTTAFDRLIAFCSSTGTQTNLKPYFFQRKDAYNPTTDISIPRNVKLMDYLKALTSRPIPGFGGTFSAKYASDRDQILTQIFDYIRSTNLNDDNIDKGYDNPSASLSQQVNANRYPGHRFTAGQVNFRDPNFGIVVPAQSGSGTTANWGMGRWPSPYGFLLVFACNADASNATSNDPTKNKMLAEPPFNEAGPALLPGEKRIQCAFIPQMFSVAGGWKQMSPHMRIEVEGLNNLAVVADGSPKSLGFPSSAHVDQTQSPFRQTGGTNYGGALINGFWPGYKVAPYPGADGIIPSSPRIGTQGQSDITNYPFVGRPITVSGNQLSFRGGEVTVKLYVLGHPSKAPTTSDPIQTFRIKIPNGTFPMPKLDGNSRGWSWYTAGYDGTGLGDPLRAGRIYTPNGSTPRLFINDNQPNANVSDVVRGVYVGTGDYRFTAGAPLIDDINVTQPMFTPHALWNDTSRMVAAIGVNAGSITWSPTAGYAADGGGPFVKGATFSKGGGILAMPLAATADATATGDFDTANSVFADGPYINKPDDGNIQRDPTTSSLIVFQGRGIPYYSAWNQGLNDSTFFSPNRMMPSPVMLGSLPTGIRESAAWRTLLFRPLAAAESSHKGAQAPMDNLLLDLFWMPVVQPYAISDRFSTAGKINMNYQILPFTYIERSTGIHAVLKSEKVAAIRNNQANIHVSPYTAPGSFSTPDIRLNVNLAETLKQFTNRFNDPTLTASGRNIFVSPSEICNLYIVPEGANLTSMASWWNGYRQTGDNLREKIYATIYPKLTTRSNTYTVHFRAQSLQKVPSTDPGSWVEGRDVVAGEYRGSTTLERYINPDADIPDYASQTASMTPTLDTFYKWRVIQNRQFAP